MCCKFRLTPQYNGIIKLFWSLVEVGSQIYKWFMRFISPICFVGANLLILSIALIFFFVFMPDFFRGSTSLYILNVAVGLYLYTNIVFHHFACAFTPPGSPSYCPDPGRILGEKVSMVDGRKIYQFSYQLNVAPYVYYRYCHTCKCIKPPRAHHCRYRPISSLLLILSSSLTHFRIYSCDIDLDIASLVVAFITWIIIALG